VTAHRDRTRRVRIRVHATPQRASSAQTGTIALAPSRGSRFVGLGRDDDLVLPLGSPGNTCDPILRTGFSGSYIYTAVAGRENEPVVFVSFFDAARFANWMHKGQGGARRVGTDGSRSRGALAGIAQALTEILTLPAMTNRACPGHRGEFCAARACSWPDSIFCPAIAVIESLGLRPQRTAFQRPWQNETVERFAGTVRRDLLDHVVVLNEDHLRRLLRARMRAVVVDDLGALSFEDLHPLVDRRARAIWVLTRIDRP